MCDFNITDVTFIAKNFPRILYVKGSLSKGSLSQMLTRSGPRAAQDLSSNNEHVKDALGKDWEAS